MERWFGRLVITWAVFAVVTVAVIIAMGMAQGFAAQTPTWFVVMLFGPFVILSALVIALVIAVVVTTTGGGW